MGKTTIGSLLLLVGKDPSFAQLYIHDTKKEIHYRLSALPGQESQYDLDIAIVQILLKTLDENNILVKTFRMARDRFKDSDMHNVRLLLIGSQSSDGREQNIPTCSEVAAIIEAWRAADKAYDVAKVDERVNRAVAAANRAANASRVAAVKAVQKQMHHNSNNNVPIPIV
ncbi:uncharacterized protein LOC115986620 [Quercus lobata]|uniref:uncharacterized protein LOC115986620 n=1 Tax=Quercus lobata TaxID=97700 RepID=UPI0012442680|nr:uncharacterized protein LOC115986620 [Quercus lobata]